VHSVVRPARTRARTHRTHLCQSTRSGRSRGAHTDGFCSAALRASLARVARTHICCSSSCVWAAVRPSVRAFRRPPTTPGFVRHCARLGMDCSRESTRRRRRGRRRAREPREPPAWLPAPACAYPQGGRRRRRRRRGGVYELFLKSFVRSFRFSHRRRRRGRGRLKTSSSSLSSICLSVRRVCVDGQVAAAALKYVVGRRRDLLDLRPIIIIAHHYHIR
jgi:hypothetical protein